PTTPAPGSASRSFAKRWSGWGGAWAWSPRSAAAAASGSSCLPGLHSRRRDDSTSVRRPPLAVHPRADVRRRRGSVAARARAPREATLAVYRIRRATAADAGVLARQRAEMFRDMSKLPDDLYDTWFDAARAYFAAAIV